MITTAQAQKVETPIYSAYMDSLSIVIPAYTEENRIKPLLDELVNFVNGNRLPWDIIVSVDGSDGTTGILESFAQEYPFVSYVKNGHRDGKGNAIKRAMSISNSSYILLMDSDRSVKTEDLLTHLKSVGDYDVLLFERYSDPLNEIPLLRRIASRGFNLFVKVILGIPVNDTQTGYKLIRTDIAKKAFKKVTVTNTFYDVSLLYYIKKMGGKIAEVSVRYFHDGGSKFNLIPEIFGQGISLLGFRIVHSRFNKYVPKSIKNIYYRKFRWI